jgi:glycosyltransferase involved in cell wall biosynthesis
MSIVRDETVSVVIPCWNAAEFVGDAIESALAQSWPGVEVVVVDDASTDGSAEVIARFEEIVSLRLGENRGGAYTRNRGAELATGRWLLFLDADDFLSPDALTWLAGTALRSPGALVACGWRELVREGSEWVARGPRRRPRPSAGRDPLRAWLEGDFVPTCSLLWPREVFDATGGWDETLTLNDDGDLALRALAAGTPLVRAAGGEGLYRRHGADRVTVSTDVRSGAKLRSAMRVLDRLSATLAGQGRLDDYRDALAGPYADVAQLAFRAGLTGLGRACLAKAGAGAGRGVPARTLPGRLLTRVLGLEGKERVTAALAGWRASTNPGRRG